MQLLEQQPESENQRYCDECRRAFTYLVCFSGLTLSDGTVLAAWICYGCLEAAMNLIATGKPDPRLKC